MDKIQEVQYKYLKKNFDLDKIFNFTLKHKVDVIMQSDQQFHCFIDYEEGDGSWGIDIDPLSAIMNGIEVYTNRTKSK